MTHLITDAAANGDIERMKSLLERGCDINEKGNDGMTALSIAAFWGYADVVSFLLKSGADKNIANNGTKWTPLHCAAFQGHGPVVLSLLRSGADTQSVDADGRTPADFASAIDAIWPLFAAAGCLRTLKAELIQKRIIMKSSNGRTGGASASRGGVYEPHIYQSRPGSAYVLVTDQSLHRSHHSNSVSYYAAQGGDVLANQ